LSFSVMPIFPQDNLQAGTALPRLRERPATCHHWQVQGRLVLLAKSVRFYSGA
jgi:hypothetical protein